ncbi:glycoside hydrolase family 2 TIM barrel-domain containing protein [Chryseosolibacter indicus]|uniref:Beta-galactosidase n=1 Tax=Chryseosolibacter indicus TaxID=2782351 RepID=A0ABS5VS89_9BACT|nr:glycoside hydrolase family 2 TIM barrel-domain containing protein [Chryseosolibacter indicus]MBT1703657.1 beta-galactosidase [Chryseosolibacter indicus]
MILRKVLLVLLFIPFFVSGQTRVRQSLNTSWSFYRGSLDVSKLEDTLQQWTTISIPHSYNTHDVLDDTPSYYRGDAWYKKVLYVSPSLRNKELYLYFEGVNQVATVFVNGKLAGEHKGGYTSFRLKINEHLRPDQSLNVIAVKVNNAFNEDIPPLTADFTFFGGIYRDVYLEAYSPVHFDVDNFASDGVFVTTPSVSEGKALANVGGKIVNTSSNEKTLLITNRLFDRESQLISSQETKIKLKGTATTSFNHSNISVANPTLWSPENPYLYRVVTTIADAKTKEVYDEVSNPVGFRWYSFTADNGFILNGKPCKLWGTSRHQDYPLMANALPDALHVRDVEILKEMGGNFLRIAHYPQDPAVLEACDRLGILTSVEIPVVNTITESKAFTDNAVNMQLEMIRQNYNHPSIVSWAYMNEVLLRLPFANDKPRQEVYFKNVVKLAKTLDSLTRKEDKERYTMAAFHGNYDLYKRLGLIDIPMVAGWNLYQGWYSPNIHGFGEFLDKHYKEFPHKPVIITEYGADGDPRIRGFAPIRFDKTVEYETYYHKVYQEAIARRPFVSGGLIWNLADFNSETRAETMPHINNKGILDSYRNPKDTYYYYQAFLLKKPFLKIGSRGWTLRSGVAVSEDSLINRQQIEVYTNQQNSIKMTNNGKVVGVGKPVNNVVTFDVPFTNGINQLVAQTEDGGVSDFVEIKFLLQPHQLTSVKLPFREINVSLGDNRCFTDPVLQQVWLPEKPYEKGSWGYVGGKVFEPANKARQQYGSDKNILNTEYDPIYETQRVGINEFKLDVPDGYYEVVLHFAELLGGAVKEALVYNLGNNDNATSGLKGNRAFNVTINGHQVIENLSTINYLVPESAYAVKTQIWVKDKRGITLGFKAIEGETILNGLQVRKIF